MVTLREKIVFGLCVLWLAVASVMLWWPAGYWMTVTSIKARDVQVGEPVPMAVVREIHRDFKADWIVSVIGFDEYGGRLLSSCYGSGTSNYKKGESLPAKLDLLWWTGGCLGLPEGGYIVETEWEIHPPFYGFPRKKIAATSNIFRVTK